MVASAGVTHAQSVRREVEDAVRREMETDRNMRRLDETGPPSSINPSLLASEADPSFRAFARQKLNAAGPLHPRIGVFMGGAYRGKTPEQAVEILRRQYQAQGGGALQSTGLPSGLPPRVASSSQSPQPTAAPAPQIDTSAIERQESMRRALELYPDAAQPDSPLTAKVREVSQRLAASNSPILQTPSAPLAVVRLAAAELGIEPVAR